MVGRAGRRGVDDAARCRRRARRRKTRGGRSATFCDPRRECTLLVGRARIRSARRRTRRRRRCSTRWRRPATPAPSWATGDSCRPIRRRSRPKSRSASSRWSAAFVPVALAREDALDEGDRTCGADRATLLARNAPDPESTPAMIGPVRRQRDRPAPHRCAPGASVPRTASADAEWDGFAARAGAVAAAVRDATGLRTVFHHHCAGYVETPHEIDALMSRTLGGSRSGCASIPGI